MTLLNINHKNKNNMTKEQIFAAFAYNIATVDGSLADSEVKRIADLADANDLDRNAVLRACQAEVDNQSNLSSLVPYMTEDDKDLAIFGMVRIAVADGRIAIKEMQRVHTVCESFGWGAQYVTIKFVQQLKKNPSLLVEGVDF